MVSKDTAFGDIDISKLRRGFTTGACATAACKAALLLLWTGKPSSLVSISLPNGKEYDFVIENSLSGKNWAQSSVRKDAGDDPDVTHKALICVKVTVSQNGRGVRFFAGSGVGIVTLAGLQLAVGEPAINRVPREMIRAMITNIASDTSNKTGKNSDIDVEISVPNGEILAKKTWNPRLGIKGGISILGTTGIVHPYSCSAWIHSIYRGIDVARANNIDHIAGSTGHMSEKAVQRHYNLSTQSLIDMGDFAGGMLKYLLRHPVLRVTIAGGVGKICKLSQGCLNLHSGHSRTDMGKLAIEAASLGASRKQVEQIENAIMVASILPILSDKLAKSLCQRIADNALRFVKKTLNDKKIVKSASVDCSILISNSEAKILAIAGN